MLKYKNLFLLIGLNCFIQFSNAATPILTTVLLYKNPSESWSNFSFAYQSGYPALYQVHISPEEGPQPGNVIFILPPKAMTNFALRFKGKDKSTDFCSISIQINSDNTPTISATPIDSNVPFTCHSVQFSPTVHVNLIIDPKESKAR